MFKFSKIFNTKLSELFFVFEMDIWKMGDGNLRLKRTKNEEKEKVKCRVKICIFAYDAKVSKTNLSGHIYDKKYIF